MKRLPPESVEKYIAGFPKDVQKLLKEIRATVKKAAPKAAESISYGIPAFRQDGPVLFYAAFKNHIGIYPAPRAAAEFKEELKAYKGNKGTIQLPLDKKLPLGLIKRIVKYRLQQNAEAAILKKAKAKAKAKKK